MTDKNEGNLENKKTVSQEEKMKAVAEEFDLHIEQSRKQSEAAEVSTETTTAEGGMQLLQKEGAVLGRQVENPKVYSPSLLEPIARRDTRADLPMDSQDLPFFGTDFWNAYEFSWLNLAGMPQAVMLEISVPCDSPNLIESKSLKLYLGSFYQTPFADNQDIIRTIESDLSVTTRAPVMVKMVPLDKSGRGLLVETPGVLLDKTEVKVQHYTPNPDCLLVDGAAAPIQESLCSHLLRTICPVTGQPDWATVVVRYKGAPISHTGLLRYIISYREYSGFHEHCIEKIYLDLMARCNPQQLTVCGYYTRRGGLDINPVRTNCEGPGTLINVRYVRQ